MQSKRIYALAATTVLLGATGALARQVTQVERATVALGTRAEAAGATHPDGALGSVSGSSSGGGTVLGAPAARPRWVNLDHLITPVGRQGPPSLERHRRRACAG
jgi:hypothetical protein